MAKPKIPEELKKLHWRQYMSAYRQRQKQQKNNLEVINDEDNTVNNTIQTIKTIPTSPTYPQD